MLASLAIVARSAPAADCLPKLSVEPVLTRPASTVTFYCEDASPLDLIHAIGYQTRTPIGIVLGYDLEALTKPRHTYTLDKVKLGAALANAIEGTGYSIRVDDGVTVLIAGDLTTRQQTILDHQFSDFHPGANQTMADLGFSLYMWIGSVLDPQTGYGGSFLSSLDDERFTLAVPSLATTEQIANLIVNQGSKGLWTLEIDSSLENAIAGSSFKVEPYQHHNSPEGQAQ